MNIAAYEEGFDLCEATGKRIFITEFKAFVYAKRVHKKNKRNGDRHAVHCYACPDCGHFHLGHMVAGRKKVGISSAGRGHRTRVDLRDAAA